MNRKYDVDEKKATHLYCSHDITKNMSEFLEEALPQVGKPINMMWSNVRLFVMFLACCAALYGQFGVKFPNEKLILAICVGTYFLFSGIVTLLDWTVIKGTSFVVRDKGGDVHVGIAMGKGESHVTLSFRRGQHAEKFKVEIDKLFDEEGVLLQTPTLNVFETHYNSFLGKKDKKKN